MSNKFDKNNIVKKEQDYNHQSYHPFKYHPDVVCFYKKPITDKSKILELDKLYFENTHKLSSIKIDDIHIYKHSFDCIIHYYELIKPEIHQMLQKLMIKDVDMFLLMEDLNKHFDVDGLLMEMYKHENDIKHLTKYIQKHNIDITNIISILYKNNVSIANLLQNKYVYDLIKQSPSASMFLSMAPNTISKEIHGKLSSKKLIKKIHVYAIIKDDMIININYLPFKL